MGFFLPLGISSTLKKYLNRLVCKIALKYNENVRKSAKLEHEKLQIKKGKNIFVTLVPKGYPTTPSLGKDIT